MSFTTSGRPPGFPGGPVAGQVDSLIATAAAALRAGDFERAGRTAERATHLAPKRPEPWMILCTALTRIGSADAEKAMAFAINHFAENDPFRAIMEADRAQLLAQRQRMDEAVALARVAASRPQVAWASHRSISSALTEAGLFEEALPHAETARRGLPNDANVNYTLATVYRYLGRLAEAEAVYNHALTCPKDEAHTYIYAGLASLKRWTPEHNHVAAIRSAHAPIPKGTLDSARIGYALFKELGDIGRYDEAWVALKVAAEEMRGIFPYNDAEKAATMAALIEGFPVERLQQKGEQDGGRPQPIFIVGLPRSGTTLVERILAAHSRVTAMGETTALGRAVKTVAGTPGPEQLDPATLQAALKGSGEEIARLYRTHTAYLTEGAELVTEKLPHNFHYVGFMRMAFPRAPIIHVQRSPMDSLFGAYRLMFGEGAYSWSYSQPDLAANYRHYRRLMDHWREGLGDDFIEIVLEDLIADPAGQIPALLERVGLAFEEACLAPEKAEGGVSTASSAQIRSPINSEGVGAWKRYARQLEPLRAELERDGFVDANGEAIWR